MATVSRAMFGGELPWTMVWIGAAVGAAIIAIDAVQKKRGSSFRVPVLAAAVGIYLPLDVTMPIFLGGILAYFVERSTGKPANPADAERMHQDGVLYSSGLITGEAADGHRGGVLRLEVREPGRDGAAGGASSSDRRSGWAWRCSR
jgi:putative OPT family oligopeptide transporter